MKNGRQNWSQQKEFNEKIKTIKKTVSSGKNVDEDKLREEVEIIKVQLNMSIIDNEALKGEISELRLENEKLRDQSVKDVIDMADISKKNEDLLSMVIKKSTLVEEEQGESEIIGTQDLMETENDVFIDDEVIAGDGKKHSLSPDSVGSGAPQEKVGRANSIDRSRVKGTSEAENPLTPRRKCNFDRPSHRGRSLSYSPS